MRFASMSLWRLAAACFIFNGSLAHAIVIPFKFNTESKSGFDPVSFVPLSKDSSTLPTTDYTQFVKPLWVLFCQQCERY